MNEENLDVIVKALALDLSPIIKWTENEGINVHNMPTPTHVNAYDTEYWRDISSKTFKLKGPQKISKYEIDFGLDIELSNRDIVQMSEDMMLLSPEIVPVIQ